MVNLRSPKIKKLLKSKLDKNLGLSSPKNPKSRTVAKAAKDTRKRVNE